MYYEQGAFLELICKGCHNKVLQTYFLKVLEVRNLRIKVLVGLISSESFLPVL